MIKNYDQRFHFTFLKDNRQKSFFLRRLILALKKEKAFGPFLFLFKRTYFGKNMNRPLLPLPGKKLPA